MSAALSKAAINPAEFSLAALSTTLATNALVERQGECFALIFIGVNSGDLDKHRLSDALGNDPVFWNYLVSIIMLATKCLP